MNERLNKGGDLLSKETDKIIERIQNLLELAEDGGNDDESQTALLLAQKLMLRYKISQQDIAGDDQEAKVELKSLSVYKRIYWWERDLAQVIADNFRVMMYMQSNHFPHQKSVQRKLVYMGLREDLYLAYDMFHLASTSMRHHATFEVQTLAEEFPDASPGQLRKMYYQGFIDGLASKFQQQRKEIQEENDKYALMIKVPKEVQEAFEEKVEGIIQFEAQEVSTDSRAYQRGYQEGKSMELGAKKLDHS